MLQSLTRNAVHELRLTKHQWLEHRVGLSRTERFPPVQCNSWISVAAVEYRKMSDQQSLIFRCLGRLIPICPFHFPAT